MMLYDRPRISAVLILSLVYMCLTKESLSIIQQTFSLQTSPFQGVKRLGQSWTDTSVVSCAKHCRIRYPQFCRSFMFNSETGLCTPGCLYSDTEPLPNKTEGKFYHSFQCDVDKGFSIRSYGGTKACIGIFGSSNMTYTEADNLCRSKGAFLVSVKTDEKLQILNQMREGKNLWIGCDDLETEGLYVWKDCGESFTYKTRPGTFHLLEPNNGLGSNEDCICINQIFQRLNDDACTDKFDAACEMPLP